MQEFNVFEDMSGRSGGGIYVGVVGPVRTGKSTFVKRFMEELVVPYTSSEEKKAMIDELPQSAIGKTVMTTQPKFVPSEPTEIEWNEGSKAKVRLVDCVGFPVEGASGFEEDGKPRLIETPWSKEPLPFERAAEIGTEKVIKDHSTIAVIVTTDGSVAELPRSAYEKAEERTVRELKKRKKPFAVVLNSANASKKETVDLAAKLEKKYGAPVMPINVAKMGQEDLRALFAKLLLEFPVLRIDVDLPEWVRSLPEEHALIADIESKLRASALKTLKMQDGFALESSLKKDDAYYVSDGVEADAAKGIVRVKIETTEQLFLSVLSDRCGEQIENKAELLTYAAQLSEAKRNYDKIKAAMEEADEYGYGAVPPMKEEMKLSPPKLVKKGSGYAACFHATAPSYHVLKVDVTGDAAPVIGSQKQGEAFVKERTEELSEDENKVWETNIFGKSLRDVVAEDMAQKPYAMPTEVRKKIRRAVGRIVNEGKGGVICILL